MALSDEEEDKIWGNMGLHFNFDPEFMTNLGNQGEYGLYKILGPSNTPKKGTGAVGLVSDEIIPVGLVHSLEVDGIYSVLYYRFHLDLPWKQKGKIKTYRLFDPESYKFVDMEMFETKKPAKVAGLIQKSIEKIIELTDQELASRLKELS